MALGRRAVQLLRPSGEYVDGRWVAGAGTSTTIEASVQPLRGKELEALPENRRTAASFKIYTDYAIRTVDDRNVRSPDILVVDGLKYEMIQALPYQSGIISHYKGIISLMETQ